MNLTKIEKFVFLTALDSASDLKLSILTIIIIKMY